MIRGKKRVVESPAIHQGASVKASIHNRFELEVIDAKTGEVKQTAFAENIILDKLWTYMGAYFQYIHYGSGTGTPVASRTSLFTFIAGKAASVHSADFSDAHTYYSKKFIQLSETEAVGQTLTEVGIAQGAGSTTLVTHALLKDMNGNNISIAKTNTDIINIYATVFVHWGTNLDIVFDDFNHALVKYFAGFNDLYTFAGASGNGTKVELQQGTVNAGGNTQTPPALTLTWDSATKKLKSNVVRMPVTCGNYAAKNRGVQINHYDGSNYCFLVYFPCYSAWNAGSNITGEAIATGDGVLTNFKTTFQLISGAKVYVDGIEQTTGVTIDEGFPFVTSYAGGIFQTIIPYGNDYLPICCDHWGSYGDVNGLVFVRTYPYSKWGTSPRMIFFRNIYHDTLGITRFTRSSSAFSNVFMSNDLVNWVAVGFSAVAYEYQNYEFIKITATDVPQISENIITTFTRTSDSNIHFASPPASGAVITADYHTQSIAKDTNHVYDFSCEFALGEYVV